MDFNLSVLFDELKFYCSKLKRQYNMKTFKVKKICFVTPFPPLEKGEAEYSRMLINAMVGISSDYYFRVWVLSPYSNKTQHNRKESDCTTYPSKRVRIIRLYNLDSIISRSLSVFYIMKALIRIKPDIVHLQYGPTSDYGGFIGEPLILLGIFTKLLLAKFVITMHSIYSLPMIRTRISRRIRLIGGLAIFYFITFIKVICTLTDKILLLSSNADISLIKQFTSQYGISESKVYITLHGCLPIKRLSYTERIAAKKQLGLSGKKIILYFGFIRREKGIEYLIKAFKNVFIKNRNAFLVIVGRPQSSREFTYFYHLKSLVKELDITDYVLFDDRYVSNEILMKYLKAADVIVLPYSESVGASGPLHLAMSFGIPIIVSHAVAFDKRTLIDVVDPTDTNRLALLVLQIIEDDELWRIKSESILKVARERDWQNIAKETLALYQSLLLYR